MIRQFAPVTKALDAALNAGSAGSWMIRVVVYDTYEGAVEALVKGEIDFSRTGPASYIHAKQKNPGVRLLAMETKDRAAAKRVFRGVICVHKDSSIDSIEDLAGKRFAFGSKTSTIGRYLAQELLIKNGIKRTDLEGASYLGRHDRVGLAVARGTFDAGALKESTFKKLVAAGEPLRQLTSFENVTKPWMSRPGLSTSSYDALRAALLDLRDAAALGALKKDGFLPAEDRHYDPIRAAIKAAEGFGT